jgi:hypothetical protein
VWSIVGAAASETPQKATSDSPVATVTAEPPGVNVPEAHRLFVLGVCFSVPRVL